MSKVDKHHMRIISDVSIPFLSAAFLSFVFQFCSCAHIGIFVADTIGWCLECDVGISFVRLR